MHTDPNSIAADGVSYDTCPAPLDCGDLTEIFRTDSIAAVRLLMTLTPTQRNLQAPAYATYLGQRQGLNLDMDDILANWECDYAHHTA